MSRKKGGKGREEIVRGKSGRRNSKWKLAEVDEKHSFVHTKLKKLPTGEVHLKL